MAVASSEASFATSGIQYGLFCATKRAPGAQHALKQAMEMLLTGEFISAEQALAQGLVNRVAAPEQLDAELEKLVAAIVSKPAAAVRMGKALVYQQRELGIEAAYQGEPVHGLQHDGQQRAGRRAGLCAKAQAGLVLNPARIRQAKSV
ncbi:enoyl-CoA hydratase-related protein [Comamonas sp. JC664]|uniref:enoyl-CoA hydratase-related protein n=1 Tax=Comamonas sp. JC664 TaxID=2801917 RepID=UPI0036735984